MVPIIATLASGNPGHEWEGSGWEGHGGWWPVFPILWSVLLVGLTVAVTLLVVRRRRRGRS